MEVLLRILDPEVIMLPYLAWLLVFNSWGDFIVLNKLLEPDWISII